MNQPSRSSSRSVVFPESFSPSFSWAHSSATISGPDEVPPRRLLPLVLAAGVAVGEVDQETVGEVGGLVGGQPGAEVEDGQDPIAHPGRRDVAGRGRGGDPAQREVEVGAAGVAREQGLRRAAEVVVDAVRVAGEGDAAQGAADTETLKA
ncbi:hypothetical protein ACGFYV_07305 [Streptomyces sp. NPDC048297]|uniref:hypothetical protein n=1 Tax=Streptomyces sp. NPDC048297 TaxID=3365531 RepID=UPI00371BA403